MYNFEFVIIKIEIREKTHRKMVEDYILKFINLRTLKPRKDIYHDS